MAAEYPPFPHLPERDAHDIAEYERKLRDGSLPADASGKTAIPPDAEAWIADFIHAHTRD